MYAGQDGRAQMKTIPPSPFPVIEHRARSRAVNGDALRIIGGGLIFMHQFKAGSSLFGPVLGLD